MTAAALLDISAYPNCAKRLHFQRVNLDEKGFGAFWAAACVAEDFADEALTEYGGFNFDDRSEENGYRQLDRLEEFMRYRRQLAKENENSPAYERRYNPVRSVERERIKSIIGSCAGIKSGKIASDDELWAVAAALWPDHIVKPAVPKLSDLVSQIDAMSKDERRVPREIRRLLPSHLRSGWTAPKGRTTQ